VAGVMAGTLALPFDMIKSRLQDQRLTAEGKLPYTGFIDCAGQIVKKEGPLALWTGYGAFLGRVTPHAIIVLLTQAALNRKYAEAIERYK
jgi:solute carrier family 25 (mitochondrial oxoglutarate transporter), member 11